jgi:hypothetical protein
VRVDPERIRHADLMARIADAQIGSLQNLLNQLVTLLIMHEPEFLAVYSPEVRRPGRMHLIATTNERKSPTVVEGALPKTFYRFDVHFPELILIVCARSTPPQSQLFKSVLALKFEQALLRKQQQLRRIVIQQSYKSRDINSFIFRMIGALREKIIFCNDLSIFLLNKTNKLSLSASTSDIRGIERKDIFYSIEEQTNSTVCCSKNSPLIEDTETGFSHETFDRYIIHGQLNTRTYWPISLLHTKSEDEGASSISAIGVIRVTNPHRRGENAVWPTCFTQYDWHVIGFCSEVSFVLLQQYAQALHIQNDMARLTHGLGASIDAAIKYCNSAREALFSENEDKDQAYRGKFFTEIPSSSMGTVDDVYRDLKELSHFLGDLHFQFSKTQNKKFNLEGINSLHGDVLMSVLRLAPEIASVHSKNTPTISNFKDAGSLTLPPVYANRDALISVFRNLVENSIKYTKERTARLDIGLSYDETFVIVDVRDYGIGVLERDRVQIFVEGFRSVEARHINNRGSGLGLSYSQHVMRALKGDLENVPCDNGALFRVKIRRIK